MPMRLQTLCWRLLILCSWRTLFGIPDRPRLARAVRETLKTNGRFAIVSWHQRLREETVILGEPRGPKTVLRLAPEQTIKPVEAGGLKFADLVEIPPYHYGAVFERPSN